MDFDITDILKMSVAKIRSTVKSGALERFFGSNVIDFIPREPREFEENDIVGFEKVLIEDTTENLYRILASNPVLFATAISNNDLKKPENVKGYSQNMQRVYSSLVKFEKEVDLAVEHDLTKYYILFRDEATRQSFKDFMKFMGQIMPYFEYAKKIEGVCDKSKEAGDEFFKIIPRFNKAIRETLVSSLVYVGNWSDLGEGFQTLYINLMNHFDSNSKFVDSKKVEYEAKKAEREELIVSKLSIVKSPVINEKEQERLDTIKQANDLYQELCLDFMRDLEKQYSESTKDMYEIFVNVKFKNFTERFNMPLSNDVSVGQARESCAQIRNLMNYISKISENAYTISVYGDNQ